MIRSSVNSETTVTIRNGHEFNTIWLSERMNLVGHLLNGLVVTCSLGDHPLGFVAIGLNSEMKQTARVPMMEKGPDIMLCSFLDFVKLKLQISGLHQMHQWKFRKWWNALLLLNLREDEGGWNETAKVCHDVKMNACTLIWHCSWFILRNSSATGLRHAYVS